MRIFKDETTKGAYFVDYGFQGKRIRLKAGASKRAAEILRNRIENEINAGTHDPARLRATRDGETPEQQTFGQLLDKFLEGYRSRGGTDYYRGIMRAPREAFEKRPVSEVTSTALEDYVRQRESVQRKDGGGRRVSDSSIRKELIALGTLFKWAKKRGLAQANPADADSIKRPRDDFDPANVRWLTDGELTALRDAAAPWLRNVITWAAETGMDKGKVRGLRLSEIDVERTEGRIVAGRFAMLRDKTGKPIRQVLSAGAIEALNAAGRVKHPSGTVFLDASGQPIAEKVLDWALACAYKTAKIAGCNFRTFRHTFATRALRRGVPTKVLAKMMGHSNAFITERYQHVADDQLEAAAQRMNGPERLTA